MSFYLKLELKPSKTVVVTNSETKEKKEVSLDYLKTKTGDPLLLLLEYNNFDFYYNARHNWDAINAI
jgi:hypothetical protein